MKLKKKQRQGIAIGILVVVGLLLFGNLNLFSIYSEDSLIYEKDVKLNQLDFSVKSDQPFGDNVYSSYYQPKCECTTQETTKNDVTGGTLLDIVVNSNGPIFGSFPEIKTVAKSSGLNLSSSNLNSLEILVDYSGSAYCENQYVTKEATIYLTDGETDIVLLAVGDGQMSGKLKVDKLETSYLVSFEGEITGFTSKQIELNGEYEILVYVRNSISPCPGVEPATYSSQRLKINQVKVNDVVAYSGMGDIVDCTEDWECTEWENCVNAENTRICTDKNSCGTLENKPSLVKSCIIGECADTINQCGGSCPPCDTFNIMDYIGWIVGIVAILLVGLMFWRVK